MRLVFLLQYVPHYLCICRYVILQADQTFPSPIPPIPSNCVQTATILEFSGFVLFVGFWVVVVLFFFKYEQVHILSNKCPYTQPTQV